MGAFLDKPKTEKLTARGEGNGVRYGVSAMQGWRMEMEDAHVCKTSQSGLNNSCFFGVFDGHAGPKVAQHCSVELLKSIVDCYNEPRGTKYHDDRISNAIDKGFIELDDAMKSQSPWSDGKDRSGTTAVVAVITPKHIYLGNCGDSRGILCRAGKVEFATLDHKPFNEAERARIEKAGGTVMMQRVNGSLAVSRALGDFDYKRSVDLPAASQLVSPEPEINRMDRDPAEDHFLLLACDGIFDVMTNEEVVAYVMRQLTLKHELTDICSSLIDKCLNKNSRDNMSVILVVFPAAPEVSEEAIQREEKRTLQAIEIIDEKLKRLADEAVDPIDLEETQVMGTLQSEVQKYGNLKDFDIYTRRTEIIEHLTELRTNKFGKDADFSGFSDPTDAPHNLVDMVLSSHQSSELEEEPSPNLEPSGQPVQMSAVADSDTTIEGIHSTTNNKTIM